VSPELASDLGRDFAMLLTPQFSWRLALEPYADAARIVWHGEEDGGPVELHADPGTSWWRRFTVDLLSILPIDGQL